MCNCQQKPCNQCSTGIPCNCPPDYSVIAAPVPCVCCPSGYTYNSSLGQCSPTVPTGTIRCCPTGSTFNQITGWCITPTGTNAFFVGWGPTYDQTYCTIPTIPCVDCEESITTDCVTFQCTTTPNASDVCRPCSNVANGDNLTTIIKKICPTEPANILAMLQVIAADTQYGLKQAFCNIVNYCSFVPGSLVPYIGPISFSIP